MALIVRSLLFAACCGVLGLLGVATPTRAAAEPSVTVGFYDLHTTDKSYLLARLDDLTHLAPTWFTLAANGALQGDADQGVVALAHEHHVQVLPVVQNYRGGSFRGEDLGIIASPSGRRALAEQIVRAVTAANADGIDVDFEELPAQRSGDFVSFIAELSAQLHRIGKKVVVDIPVEHGAYAIRRLAPSVDWLLLMAYDQHSLPREPGPISALPWAEQALSDFARELSPHQIILGLGGYGYDWGPKDVQPLSFNGVMGHAATAETILWDSAARAPWFHYAAPDGSHTIWFNDAASLQPLLRLAESAQVAGVSVWRLGVEDPGLWDLMSRGIDSGRWEALQTVQIYPQRDGTGEMVRAVALMHRGRRLVKWDSETDQVIAERYLELPKPLILGHARLQPGTVALSFDDGPDPRWTPRILDILKQYGVRATFFVIGNRASQHPELVSRIYAAGHEIGNHTFTHAVGLDGASDWRFSLELSATQRVIEGATGHSATLFRYPFLPALGNRVGGEEPLVERPSRLGYWVAGYGIDTADWERPGAGLIAARAQEQPDGQIILMHDGGGDRSQTVAALPSILEGLRARGLRAVPLEEATGAVRADAMPAAPPSSVVLGRILLATGWAANRGSVLFWGLVTITLLVGFARIMLLGILGILHWALARPPRDSYDGPVTAIVPAYNEEAVIGRTLEALLRSDHSELEILVIDDGSTDGTADVVSKFAHRGVRLIRQSNAGKAMALWTGFKAARHPVVVALDADTLFTAATVRRLVQPLGDLRVGAVSGNARVGNRVNMLTRLQSLEYVLTLNLERRAYALLNCIPVVPGAVGAWRRDAVQAVGGFTASTLAEDTDVTLALGRAGYRVAYSPGALAYTEAPQTLRGLIRQRTRWSFGMLQCLWKHRRATFSPRAGALGLVAIPGLWLSQVLFPTIAPAMDLGLVLSPLTSSGGQVVLATVVYNAALIGLALWALAVEHEHLRLAGLVPLQNLLYRQFSYAMALKSVVRAFRGVRMGWHRIERLGTSSLGRGRPLVD